MDNRNSSGQKPPLTPAQTHDIGMGLIAAAEAGDETALRALLKEGAHGPLDTRDTTAALIAAVEQKSVACVELLLAVADPKANKAGETALMGCCAKPSPEAHEIFLRLLPLSDPKATTYAKDTALMIAVSWNNKSAVQALLPVSDADARDRWGRNALMTAAAGESEADEEMLAWMIDATTDIDARDKDGMTALMLAAAGADRRDWRGHRLLLGRADANARSPAQSYPPDGWSATPLEHAIRRGEACGGLECVEDLLPFTDIAVKNEAGLTPFEVALSVAQFKIADVLAHGASAPVVAEAVKKHGMEMLPKAAEWLARQEAAELGAAVAHAQVERMEASESESGQGLGELREIDVSSKKGRARSL